MVRNTRPAHQQDHRRAEFRSSPDLADHLPAVLEAVQVLDQQVRRLVSVLLQGGGDIRNRGIDEIEFFADGGQCRVDRAAGTGQREHLGSILALLQVGRRDRRA